jgi:glycyl-tRNA synthetase beta chain
MPELLLEVGCEELPASFVQSAYQDLAERLKEALAEAYQSAFEATSLGTPRRLIVSIQNLPARQPDATKELRGPGLKAAYDADGNPTPALLGFCRSNNLEPSDLRKDEQYVWATKLISGLPTVELLATLIPAAIRKLTFEKSMRWGPLGAKFRFARPIRWILAAYDRKLVSFELEGVNTGLHSFGHRLYAPERFAAGTLEELVAELRKRKVEPDPTARKEMLLTEVEGLTLTADLPEELVDENVFLTEWPTPVLGEFRKEFLDLPEPVLTTAMAKHEKMFPIRDGDGKLKNEFIFVRNSGEDATVRRGAEWVLNARLADAEFFYREDKKYSMHDFLEKTSGIVFQAQLGTVRQRADRLAALTKEIALHLGADQELGRLAGLYAKADLSTGLVAEFNSLQGKVGSIYYARAAEHFPEVADAIANQYTQLQKGVEHSLKPVALALVVADAVDKLTGYIGIGLVPSGSADPYGLRRCATNLILSDIGCRLGQHSNLQQLFTDCAQQYVLAGIDIQADYKDKLNELFLGRFATLYGDEEPDLLQAALGDSPKLYLGLHPHEIRQRLQWLKGLGRDASLVQTLLRPLNILKSLKDSVGQLPDYQEKLASPSGLALYQTLKSSENEPADQRLRTLAPKIHAFFEETMVMDQDPIVRSARLNLVQDVRNAIITVGDFTKIVIEGN